MSLEWVKSVIGHINVTQILTDDQITEIGANVKAGYDEDKLSRSKWEISQEGYMKLAMQVMEDKNTPWSGASNVKYPLLTTATMQFGARAYPALITSPSIVKGRVTGFDETGEKAKSAERVGKHMSYQLIEEMDGWEEDMDKLSVSLPILGDLFKKTYFSPAKQKNVSELVYPKKFVVNYWSKSILDAPRMTHELDLTDNDIYERITSGLFVDQEYIKIPVEDDAAKNELHGLSAPPLGDTTPNESLEQHCWIDLDGDGYKEPYIVTMVNGRVARVIASFDEEGVILSSSEKIICIKRIEYFTKYGFIPNPDGSFYDIGFGVLLGPINETINTTINQLIDAGTMANRSAGFLGRGARIKGGLKSFDPFEWKVVNASGDDLRKSIVPLPVREPSNVLFSLLGLMIEAGKELSNTVPMLMGQNPGQNQTATTSMAVIEQGLKVFSAIFKRMHRSLKHELKLIKRLNKLYLPEEAYFNVLDKEEGREQIFKRDYSDDITDVQPYSDPNIVSELQVMIKAQQVSEMMAQGLIPNQVAGARLILESMDLPNLEALLTPPEPQINPEFELKRAEFEHKVQMDKARLQLDGARLALDEDIADDLEQKYEAEIILNIAKAEAAEDGAQLAFYAAQLDRIRLKMDAREKDKENERNENEQRSVRGLDGAG